VSVEDPTAALEGSIPVWTGSTIVSRGFIIVLHGSVEVLDGSNGFARFSNSTGPFMVVLFGSASVGSAM
jgi:hypothetical protein